MMCLWFTLPMLLACVNVVVRVHVIVCDVPTMILAYHKAYCKSTLCYSNNSSSTTTMLNSETTTTTRTELAQPSFNLDISFPGMVKLRQCDICTDCSCDKDCIFYGTCCPDIHIGHPQFSVDCVQMVISQTLGSAEPGHYYMVTNCTAESFANSDGICDKCSEGIVGFSTKVDDFPVTVNVSGRNIAFKNKFCAESLGFYDYMIWRLSVICRNKIDLKGLQNVKNVYSLVERLGCTFAYIPPKNIDLKVCSQSTSIGVVSRCNSTGKWKRYDRRIDNACNAYTNPTRAFKKQDLVFANIFCLLCNNEEDRDVLKTKMTCPMKLISVNVYYFPPAAFSAILNFQDDVELILQNDSHKCVQYELFDTFTDQCRKPVCPELRRYHENKCEWIVDNLHGVQFQMNAHLFPNTSIFYFGNLTNVKNFDTDILNQVIRFFKSSIHLSNIIMNLVVEQESQLLKYILVVLKFDSDYSVKPQDFINRIMLFEMTQFVANIDGTSVRFSPTVVYPESMTVNLTAKHSTIVLSTVELHLHISEMMSAVISVLPNNDCPMFEYSLSELVIKDDSVFSRLTNKSINSTNVQRTASGSISVCVHRITFLHQTLYTRGRSEKESSLNTLTVTSVVFITASLVCLLLTFLVYSLVRELHTVPGINLIYLCVSLFLAHGFFLLGSGATRNRRLCQAFGVLIHYFWLVSFCWMNICSLYTFIMFSKVKPLNTKQNKRPTVIKFLVFSTVLPLLLVIIVVVTGLASRSGSIGYGDGQRVCFISSTLIFNLTFLVPMGISFIMTSVVLVMAGMSLKKVSARRKALGQKKLNILLQCFKLSSLTGVSWIFGSLGSFLRVEILNYVFIVLSGGQGVFILIAFVLNKPVLRACRTAFRRRFFRNRTTSICVEMKESSQFRCNLSTTKNISSDIYTINKNHRLS